MGCKISIGDGKYISGEYIGRMLGEVFCLMAKVHHDVTVSLRLVNYDGMERTSADHWVIHVQAQVYRSGRHATVCTHLPMPDLIELFAMSDDDREALFQRKACDLARELAVELIRGGDDDKG